METHLGPHFVDPSGFAPFSSLPHLLEYQAKRIPEAPAILAPGRAPLTYGRLYQHIQDMECTLRAMGIGRRDRVAVALPNGPEMALAILSVAASATCAPLNPAYRTEELNNYFADLQPHALIMQAGMESPARCAALSRDVRVIELSPVWDADAGLFMLRGDKEDAPPHEAVGADDVALLIATSGTTSRPKIVPQTHVKLCVSAHSTGAALALRQSDRCLNILPLFHGHGLIATVLASLAAGASVVCTPGLDVENFHAWLTGFQATWYSAVPAMHQAILGHARRTGETLAEARLRLVRSSSAPLPPRIFAELEQNFESCVIEWYGMTEVAASPITCNPLPPRLRKPGSVGAPVALEVATMDERGGLLPSGQIGQVVVRGASVMAGYDNDPDATEAAFAGDWFKTGDLGYFDDDGYLFLVGRTREMINRGGEKVAPREVDEVLLQHPAVAEAVTFAVPHPTLGEEVASAVVLRPDSTATPKDIRRFAIARVADFKVPREVLIVNEIPKGPTGKVQRRGLAAKLGLTAGTAARAFVAPRTPLEEALVKRWAEILQIDRISVHDDFFASGGDSLLAVLVLQHVYEIAQVELAVSLFFQAPTVAEVAQHIQTMIQAGPTPRPSATFARAPREDRMVPASVAQERIWNLQHALPDIPCFNILYPLRLTSPCDIAILERSINEIVRRHDILRTTFAVTNGQHVQVVAPQLIVPVRFDDLRALPPSGREVVGHELIQDEVLHSFDLAKGPLMRVRLVHKADEEYLLLISMHQIICDGWSLGVFADELVALYDAFSAGKGSPLAPRAIQYADFARWQRRWRSNPQMVAQLAYWREQLSGPLPLMEFATSAKTGTVDDLCTGRREWTLPANLSEAAKNFSHQHGSTLFMILVAALKILLHCYLGQDDLRVATNVANRNRAGTKGLIGPLVNTVILRTDLGGDPSAQEVLRRVRTTALAAFANQEVPFEEIVKSLETECDFKPPELSNMMILLQNTALRPTASWSDSFSFEEANPNMLSPLVTLTTYDAILMLRERLQGLAGTCVYKPHLFASGTIDRLLGDFQEVLEWMTTQPDRPISAIRVSLNER
jgi:acyl-CoA synthetase (AMP-forming)/AMP-acid ligase II